MKSFIKAISIFLFTVSVILLAICYTHPSATDTDILRILADLHDRARMLFFVEAAITGGLGGLCVGVGMALRLCLTRYKFVAEIGREACKCTPTLWLASAAFLAAGIL